MIRIYVAGPYSQGDQVINVKKSIEATEELYRLGFNVFNPMLTHFHSIVYPREYEHWMKVDFDWIHQCDAILRLPGFSPGAERECKLADNLGKPVFDNIVDLEYWFLHKK